MASLNRAETQRAFLQAQLESAPKRHTLEVNPIPTPTGNFNTTTILTPLEAAQKDLVRLLAQRSDFRSKGYTANYPDVQRNEREIAQSQAIINRLKASAPQTPRTPAPAANAVPQIETGDDVALAQLKSNIEANRIEIGNLTKEENRLKAEMAHYENRLNQTPVREQEQAGIMRDTEVLRAQYSELLKKEQESQLATNLEKQQGGQQFRLIDPASLPSVPSSPKRAKLSMGGMAGGLALGLVLAFLMEMRNTSFRTESEITKFLAPPLVVGIPLLITPKEQADLKWRNRFQVAAASVMLLIVLGAEFVIYRHG
jgi:hypothetical protein